MNSCPRCRASSSDGVSVSKDVRDRLPPWLLCCAPQHRWLPGNASGSWSALLVDCDLRRRAHLLHSRDDRPRFGFSSSRLSSDAAAAAAAARWVGIPAMSTTGIPGMISLVASMASSVGTGSAPGSVAPGSVAPGSAGMTQSGMVTSMGSAPSMRRACAPIGAASMAKLKPWAVSPGHRAN